MNRNAKWDSFRTTRYIHEIVYIYARIKRAFANANILSDNLDNRELREQLERMLAQFSGMRKMILAYMSSAGIKRRG